MSLMKQTVEIDLLSRNWNKLVQNQSCHPKDSIILGIFILNNMILNEMFKETRIESLGGFFAF